jgi:RNA polymerase sigma factor (sigma-70 family)
MGEAELRELINGCAKQDRKSQKMLYKAFYGFSMSICLRYSADRDEAAGIMNQGFLKVFTKINTYDTDRPFKAWLARIMTNVSIDYYRANLKMAYTDDLEQAEHLYDASVATDNNLHYADLLAMVKRLPQGYRTVFNLYAIDGYTHEQIADMLNINIGTSKSNLFKARQKLKQMILDAEAPGSYGSGTSFTPVVAINVATVIPGFYNDKGVSE